jgi:hypothetical protein
MIPVPKFRGPAEPPGRSEPPDPRHAGGVRVRVTQAPGPGRESLSLRSAIRVRLRRPDLQIRYGVVPQSPLRAEYRHRHRDRPGSRCSESRTRSQAPSRPRRRVTGLCGPTDSLINFTVPVLVVPFRVTGWHCRADLLSLPGPRARACPSHRESQAAAYRHGGSDVSVTQSIAVLATSGQAHQNWVMIEIDSTVDSCQAWQCCLHWQVNESRPGLPDSDAES